MKPKKIVITGAPGTGKSSVIHKLSSLGNICLQEVSREIIIEARESGIDRFFAEKPLLFSDMIIKGRTKQFHESSKFTAPAIFYDRGLPDVLAYLDFINHPYPENFKDICRELTYEMIFILPPWKEIYTRDNERFEDFEEVLKIHAHLEETYNRFNYKFIHVPLSTVEERVKFIMEKVNASL